MITIIVFFILSAGWIIFEVSRAPLYDDEGNRTDKDGNII
jgi:hypothetical protein